MTFVIASVKPLLGYDSCVRKDSLRDAIALNVIRLLRETREERGLSMNVVAQKAGLSQSIVSLVERDLRNPTLDTLLRIAEVLEVDLGKIITEAGKLAAQETEK